MVAVVRGPRAVHDVTWGMQHTAAYHSSTNLGFKTVVTDYYISYRLIDSDIKPVYIYILRSCKTFTALAPTHIECHLALSCTLSRSLLGIREVSATLLPLFDGPPDVSPLCASLRQRLQPNIRAWV